MSLSMLSTSERTRRNQKRIPGMSHDGNPCRICGNLNPWQRAPSLSFSRCYTSQHLGPSTPSPLKLRAPPFAAHPGGNSYTSFMTFCMSTPSRPLVFPLSFLASSPPYPVPYSPSLFVISRYPRGGKQTRTQGSSRFRGPPFTSFAAGSDHSLLSLYFYLLFLFVLEHLSAGAPSGFPSARFRMLLTPSQQ